MTTYSATIDISNIGGTAEVANLLGCPKQQIHALRRRKDFPRPVCRIAASPIWDLNEIRKFGETWVRRKQH